MQIWNNKKKMKMNKQKKINNLKSKKFTNNWKLISKIY